MRNVFRARGLVKLWVAPPSPSDGSAQILNQSTLKPESSKEVRSTRSKSEVKRVYAYNMFIHSC